MRTIGYRLLLVLARILRPLIVMGLLLAPVPLLAATCTFSANGKWSGGGSCGVAPTAADDCVVNANIEVLCDAATCACGSLTANGHVYTNVGDRTIKIGDGASTGPTDSITIASGGSLVWGPGQTVEINTTSAAQTNALITNNGYMAATGQVLTDGIIGSFTQTPAGDWPNREISIHDRRSRQTAIDQYAGMIFVPTTGYFRWQWFDIVTGAASTSEIVIAIDTRGAVDSRGKSGRVNPAATTWAPGDWGTTYSTGTATTNGTTTVTFAGGASMLASNVLGARFICTAGTDDDSQAAFTTNVRRICQIDSTTQVTLCTAYPNSSCAGGTYVIYDDNQPPIAAEVVDSFAVGDRYLILDPAILTATNKSNVNSNGHFYLIANSGSTTSFFGTEIGYCGQKKSGGSARDCLDILQIDNSLATEGFYFDLVDLHHVNGEMVMNFDDNRNMTLSRFSLRDCSEGGADDGNECHGIRFNDLTGNGRVENNIIEDFRIMRLNDDAFTWYASDEANGVVCNNCTIRRGLAGFLGVNTVVTPSAQVFETSTTATVTGLAIDSVMFTNSDGETINFASTTNTHVTSAAISNSLLQNSQTSAITSATVSEANSPTNANFNVVYAGNLIRNCCADVDGPGATTAVSIGNRGRYYNNVFDHGNERAVSGLSLAQAVYGNIFIGPPAARQGNTLFVHQPSDDNLSPASVKIYDNVFIGNRTHTGGQFVTYIWLGLDLAAAQAVGYDFQHNSIFGANDTLAAFETQAIETQGPAGRTSTISNNVLANFYTGLGSGGAHTVTHDYNLYWAVVDVGLATSANDLITGVFGPLNPTTLWPDFLTRPGSTTRTSLGSDGAVRGVRLAGPNSRALRAVYPFLSLQPFVNNTTGLDSDYDGIWDLHDNCDFVVNVLQTDGDVDGKGDVCDAIP